MEWLLQKKLFQTLLPFVSQRNVDLAIKSLRALKSLMNHAVKDTRLLISEFPSLCEMLMSQLERPSTLDLLRPLLKMLGSFLNKGSDWESDVCVKLGVLDRLDSFLFSFLTPVPLVRCSMFVLYNISYCESQTSAILDHPHLLGHLFSAMRDAPVLLRLTFWIIDNLICHCQLEQMRKLLSFNFLFRFLKKELRGDENEFILMALASLGKLLEQCIELEMTDDMIVVLEDQFVFDDVEGLRTHNNASISQNAINFLDEFVSG